MSCRISLLQSTLIGAPNVFPVNRLHHSVVIASLDGGERHLLDVVPLHPSDPKVLLRLLSGRTEPAVARCKRLSREELLADAHVSKACVVVGIDPSGLLELGRRFCHDFFDPGPPTINLYTRNCVLFATCLYDHLASGRGQRLS